MPRMVCHTKLAYPYEKSPFTNSIYFNVACRSSHRSHTQQGASNDADQPYLLIILVVCKSGLWLTLAESSDLCLEREHACGITYMDRMDSDWRHRRGRHFGFAAMAEIEK
ncbi:hypothetical protein CAPTEDRAFT_220906 [Capitella teleta]|uniref:Uncharacterized protein n=1 Tax=Capitella teleta TaxID=283909 RepID=R7TXQ4_CAPTE|nr:hypothetical protein CAPTEDRAFT_220906 [Capitella teleta]|eukprot:ELT98708.1 hypothetical protein CAPTEDRAFT_220906 [Capitella teleta]